MNDSSGNSKWYYDKRGRLIQEEKTVLGNQYRTVWVYNNADQVTQMIYPSKEKVKYTYLPQGNLRGVGNYQWDLKTDEHNRVKEKSLFDGNKITYSYYGWLENSGGTLKNITAFKGSNNILEFRYQYDELGNVSQIKDRGNAFQTQYFEYDQLNRLVRADTDGFGEGQYHQRYSYDPGSGNLKNHSELGDYTYNALHPHAVETAGGYSYTYDENGNATSRTVNGQTESYMYDSENRLIEIESQNGSLKKYLYDGDGNRVARLDANNEGAIFIGNYFESEYPWIEDGRPPIDVGLENPGDTSLCEAETENCVYLPVLAREANLKPFPVKRGTSYYYADGQRIAMRTGGEAYLLFGDHLGSSSVVMNANGEVVEKAYYLPWGGERGDTSITSTDYGYTGQMKEGDIYYYGARYYDPAIGRFMQADTIVPLQVQGTQAFDRYAYVNNNPLRYTDPTGHYYQECGDDNYGRCGTISPPTPKIPWYEQNGVYVFRGSGYFGKPMLGPISPSQDASMLDPSVSGISPLHIGGNVLDIVNSQLGMYLPTVMPVDKDNVFWELVFRVFDEKIYVKSFSIESKISEIYVKYISVILKFTYTETQNQIYSGDVEMELMHDVFLYEHPHGYKKEFNDYVKFPVDALSIDLNIRMYCKFCSTNNGPLFDTIHQKLK